VVFDTNVLVSLYVFADSRFAPLRSKLESGAWLALTNDACFGEFRRVLAYPMFALDAAAQGAALAPMMPVSPATWRRQPKDIAALPRCKDRDDQKFLELARDAGADWLVSADKALLRLARRDRCAACFESSARRRRCLRSKHLKVGAGDTARRGQMRM
jgi:predicted nucleic acid-binding protein